jgi:hypothetical protein
VPHHRELKPVRRNAGRRASSDPSGRGPRASFGQQLATIQKKLDAIMNRMMIGLDPIVGDKPAQPEAAAVPDGHHAEHEAPLAA